MSFAATEKARMTELWSSQYRPGDLLPSGFQLRSPSLNLLDLARDPAVGYFRENAITWHLHANHALSSQAACLNFLMPLATRPALLRDCLAAALGDVPDEMVAVDTDQDGQDLFVGFEWPGRRDYLNECGGRPPQRGANATNADAVVRVRRGGLVETILIEWKYTESYKQATQRWAAGNQTRLERYADLTFSPNGPVRAECGLAPEAFFHEPVYQLLRQQMLAYQMQRHREDGADRVRVLHVSPAQNTALHRMTAPGLPEGDVFEVFASLLERPEDFTTVTTDRMFAPLARLADIDTLTGEWISQLERRYPFAFDG